MIMTRLFADVISFSYVWIKSRSCWATEVKSILFRNGFGYTWIHQEVGNEVEFLKSFKQLN